MKFDNPSGSTQTAKTNKWNVFMSLLVIFSIAIVVRHIGLKFGFPLFTHPDEGYIMNNVREMSLYHRLNPGTYIYPALPSLYSKYLIINILSLYRFCGNYGWFYWHDPFLFYYASRLMTAVQGALIPVVAWFIGRKYKKINISWTAAFLFAFYPPFVLHSHYVTVDIPLTLYIMLVILFCLNYLSSGKKYWLVLACIIVSIAALEKYPGILSFGIILATIGIQAFRIDKKNNSPDWRWISKSIFICFLICVVAISIIGLPLIMNIDIAWKQIEQEARPDHLGADGLGWGGNLLYYLKDFYVNAGFIVCLLGAAGLVAAISIKNPAVLLLFFGGGYWLALSILSLHHSRWSLPMMITPLFLAAIGASFLWQKMKSRTAGKIALFILLLAGFVPFILKGTVTSVMLTWKDTRNEALHYMQEYDISDDKTISDGYSPYNPGNKNDIYEFDILNPGEKKYIVLSSFMENRFAAEPGRYVTENAFYAKVRSHSVLIKDFRPDQEPTYVIEQLRVVFEYLIRQFRDSQALYRTGPELEIYELRE